MRIFGTLTAALALAAVFTLPAAAATEQGATQHLQYDTTFTPEVGVGQFDGKLDVTISPDGIVSGYYRPWDEQFVPVTGGLDGKNVWLDFGFMGRLHMTGTVENGKIVGSTWIGNRVFNFSARPTT